MTEEERKTLAREIAEELKSHHGCQLTEDEQQAMRDLIRTKKNAVRAALWLFGAVVIWILKDVYIYIATHLNLVWGK